MTPETAQTITAVAAIIERLGTWPVGTLVLAIIIGPWIFAALQGRGQEKRFASMEQMYKNNVKLVDGYEKLAALQHEVVTLNTAKWTEVKEKIETNQFCPLNRTKKHRMEDVT